MEESPQPQSESSAEASGSYRLARALGGFWLRLSHGRLRLLRGETLPSTGPVLLVLNGAPNFRHLLALVAVVGRPIRFVLDEDAGQGFLRNRAAEALEVIVREKDPSREESAMTAAREALANGEAVAIFAQAEIARSEALSPSCVRVAKLAVEAETGRQNAPELNVFPLVVLDLSGAQDNADLLMYVGAPLHVREALLGGAGDASIRRLAGELEDRLADNPFRLQEPDVKFFLADLETILRADLAEDWAARPNWKQTADGFDISRFIVECIEQLNVLDPACLIRLRVGLERYREAFRLWSLRQAEVEASGAWSQSALLRTWYWIESLVGFPMALYGFLNHLVPLGILSWRGLLRRVGEKDPGQAWLTRALVLLICYVAQVALCAHWWGRAVTGYYTVTLPVSGAYLWRYYWMLKARTRLLYAAATLEKKKEKLRRSRKAFLEELNKVRDAYATALTPAK